MKEKVVFTPKGTKIITQVPTDKNDLQQIINHWLWKKGLPGNLLVVCSERLRPNMPDCITRDFSGKKKKAGQFTRKYYTVRRSDNNQLVMDLGTLELAWDTLRDLLVDVNEQALEYQQNLLRKLEGDY